MLAVQCKMARVALDWGVRELAAAAGVSPGTVARFEAGEELKDATVAKIQAALEKAGIEFTPSNGFGEGVRFKKPPQKRG